MNIHYGHVFRIAIGAGLILMVAYVYLPHLFFTYSITATITAPIVPVSSPITGILQNVPPHFTEELNAGDVIGVVENPRFDRKGLDDNTVEMNGVKEKIDALKAEKERLNSIKVDLGKSLKEYQASLIERSSLEIERSKKRLKESQDTIDEKKLSLRRTSKLYEKGAVAQSQVDSAYYNNERSLSTAESAELEMTRLTAQLEALQKGIYVNMDGRTDVPYQQQRIDDVTMRQTVLDSSIREFQIRYDNLKKLVELETARVKLMSTAKIKAPFYSVVWRAFGNQGNYQDTVRPIVELLDCTRVFMEATVHERHFEKIEIGHPVQIKLVGSPETLKGSVMAVRGGSINSDATAFLAAANSAMRPREIQIMIHIPEEELRKTKGKFCHVGRTGEVLFEH